MKARLFLMILFLPVMLTFNFIGILYCLSKVAFENGYEHTLELLKKASER
jgi:hypothetical protein